MSLKRILLGFLALLVVGSTWFWFTYLRAVPPYIPTGKHNVGATSFDFTYDSDITQAPRKINVRAWYPTDVTSGKISIVSTERVGLAALQVFGMPEFLNKVEDSLSFKDAPIAVGDTLYPVIIFNHGFASFAEQNTSNMQELASHGYILLSVSHPDTSLVTEYTDGSYVMYDKTLPAYQEFADFEAYSTRSVIAMRTALAAMDRAEGFGSYWAAMRELAQSVFFGNMQPILRQWIEDNNILVNAMTDGQVGQFSPIFADRIDAEHIGIMGHSLGGMAALGTSVFNGSIGAVINLDAAFAYDIPVEQVTLNTPTCILMGDQLLIDGEVLNFGEINVPLLEQSDQPGCNVVFRGAAHMNFSDLNYIPFLKLLPVLGSVDQEDFGIELNHILLSFFNRHLKGVDQDYTPVFDNIVDYREF